MIKLFWNTHHQQKPNSNDKKTKEKQEIQQTLKNSFFKTTERILKFFGVLKSYRNVVF